SLRYSVYLYCPRCRVNTTHRVLGYHDPYTGQYVQVNQTETSVEGVSEFD
ncbi:MAG: hypothetical protein GU355_08045, partial [Caldivirga sp.]|nr:hypothetical protein [Caldivirga sp.]